MPTLENGQKIYIFLGSILRTNHQLFNLGLVKKNGLKDLHDTQITHQCLVSKLAFFLELQNLAQKRLGNLSFEIINRPNLLLETRNETRQDLFALFLNQLKQHRTFFRFRSYFGVTSSYIFLFDKHLNWSDMLFDYSRLWSKCKNRESHNDIKIGDYFGK